MKGQQGNVVAQQRLQDIRRQAISQHINGHSTRTPRAVNVEGDKLHPQLAGNTVHDVAVGGEICRINNDAAPAGVGRPDNGLRQLVEIDRGGVDHECLAGPRTQAAGRQLVTGHLGSINPP